MDVSAAEGDRSSSELPAQSDSGQAVALPSPPLSIREQSIIPQHTTLQNQRLQKGGRTPKPRTGQKPRAAHSTPLHLLQPCRPHPHRRTAFSVRKGSATEGSLLSPGKSSRSPYQAATSTARFNPNPNPKPHLLLFLHRRPVHPPPPAVPRRLGRRTGAAFTPGGRHLLRLRLRHQEVRRGDGTVPRDRGVCDPGRHDTQGGPDLSANTAFPPFTVRNFYIPIFGDSQPSPLPAVITSLQPPLGDKPAGAWLVARYLVFRIWLSDCFSVVSPFSSRATHLTLSFLAVPTHPSRPQRQRAHHRHALHHLPVPSSHVAVARYHADFGASRRTPLVPRSFLLLRAEFPHNRRWQRVRGSCSRVDCRGRRRSARSRGQERVCGTR